MAVVVYAVGSRTIRRVIVSDVPVDPGLVDGEAVMEVPQKTYTALNANTLRDYVASVIGEPLHDCRCVELDKDGQVVDVYAADPVIDKPKRGKGFSIELSKVATLGDVRQRDGKFLAAKDVP